MPRDKTCAGGVIPKAVRLLQELQIPFALPHAAVDAAHVAVPGSQADVRGNDLCRIVRRREFDALLAWMARDRVWVPRFQHPSGLSVRPGEPNSRPARRVADLRCF